MPKDYIQDLQQITMYSKIGRYISNKLLKYRSNDNKSNATLTERPSFKDNIQAKDKMSMTAQGFNLKKINSTMIISKDQKIAQSKNQKNKKYKKGNNGYNCYNKQQKQNNGQHVSNRASSQSNNEELRSNTIKGKQIEFHPSVGHYKVNYGLIEKTPRFYDFNRSVPHFYNKNKKLNQSTPVFKEYPDGFFKNSRGFKQLKRMAGRQNIKGSIRKNQENPHESRYILHQDFNSIQKKKSPIKMDKITSRDNRMFKNMENSPDYDYNFEINKKKLASHLVPFERQTQRKGEMFLAKTGISQQFMSYSTPQDSYRSVLWNKALNRQKNGLVPSYLDKTIHSRLAISMANFKTLQMNCSDMHRQNEFDGNLHKKSKNFKNSSRVVYVQQQQD